MTVKQLFVGIHAGGNLADVYNEFTRRKFLGVDQIPLSAFIIKATFLFNQSDQAAINKQYGVNTDGTPKFYAYDKSLPAGQIDLWVVDYLY